MPCAGAGAAGLCSEPAELCAADAAISVDAVHARRP